MLIEFYRLYFVQKNLGILIAIDPVDKGPSDNKVVRIILWHGRLRNRLS